MKNLRPTHVFSVSAALAAGAAQGSVTITDFSSGNTASGGNAIYFDLDGGTLASGFVDGQSDFKYQFEKTSGSGNNGRGPAIERQSAANTNLAGEFIATLSPDTRGLPLTEGGVTIDDNSFGATEGRGAFYYNAPGSTDVVGDWIPEANVPITGYVGLRLGNDVDGWNYGWANFTYTWDGSESDTDPGTSTLTLNSLGYETDLNTPIVTPVPEPSAYAYAAMAAGFAGLVAMRAKRRRA